MRWNEETSFRESKYTIGIINWHSSKVEGILQEINARMILYNFCELVTAHAVVKTRDNTKLVFPVISSFFDETVKAVQKLSFFHIN